MESDARRLRPGAGVEADLCIIGAGPTGLTLARACVDRGIRTVLLESGGAGPERAPQELNEGLLVGGPYAGLRATRHRQVGGTAATWNTPYLGLPGAKYVPLDPWDFRTGWLVGFDALEPWYRQAQAVAGLGPFRYDAAGWAAPGDRLWSLPADVFRSQVYQYGPASLFTHTYPALLRASADARLLHHATVVGLDTDGSGRRITGARVVAPGSAPFMVRADRFVLAGGAVENARLLLLSKLGGPWVGRGFMEHPRDSALTLEWPPDAPEPEAAFYRPHAGADGTVISGRFALAEPLVVEEGLPNASITLLPRPAEAPRGRRRWFRRAPEPAPPPGFLLYINLEQRAHPDNRLSLGGVRDALGMPRAVLYWRWREEEQAGLERLRRTVIRGFGGLGIGTVRAAEGTPPNPNAHHHAGTTRMGRVPGDGVVDAELRVHGIENLHAVGASVFPSAGFANPTLTCLALALRLAHRLGS